MDDVTTTYSAPAIAVVGTLHEALEVSFGKSSGSNSDSIGYGFDLNNLRFISVS